MEWDVVSFACRYDIDPIHPIILPLRAALVASASSHYNLSQNAVVDRQIILLIHTPESTRLLHDEADYFAYCPVVSYVGAGTLF